MKIKKKTEWINLKLSKIINFIDDLANAFNYSNENTDYTDIICNDKYNNKVVTPKFENSTDDTIGNKIYECKTCAKCFYNKNNLKRHSKTINCQKKIDNKTCIICNKIYADKQGFQKHVKTKKHIYNIQNNTKTQ